MISPELLRRYPFFGNLDTSQLKALAMIAEAEEYAQGAVIFEEGGPAEILYLLVEGSVELYYRTEDGFESKNHFEHLVGEINPGEIFSISSLVEPYLLNATGKAARKCKVIHFEAKEMRRLLEQDKTMGYFIMKKAAKEVMARLVSTRVQLASAR